ncbi:Ig-like domain-containing protein [Pseudomonas moraviensis]|uniref:Ig-like domain-containing protein n=1 Tax=Pseudomonas moraviensis TaxID=321662 RepID=A0A7Y9VSP7_9PSED|nr:Ig-like domain-containing protein [Pseudomonas moraviensis]NYH07453.1 hypothetical protein [Pseudomonas moraviensis]
MFTFRRSLFPSRNELLAPLSGLYPPYFADMVIPVPGADGGINRKAYEAFEAGLFTVIDPPPGGAIGDLLEVFLNDEKVGELKVKDEHLNQRWFFFVPKDGLLPGLFTCHYVLTRAGETVPDDPSATLTLLLEIDDPAGPDKRPFEPWHSELKKVGLPQDVIDNGVTKEWADKGVPMTITPYPKMAVGDIILAMWGSVFLLPHVLTQAEVDGTAEIIVMARPEDILTAGDSAAMKIHYDVCDLVYNWSVKWSEATSVPVDAGVSRLDALIIKEADDGKIILADLDAKPVTLQILIKANDVFTAGDTLLITVIGTPIPGRPPQTFTVETIVRNPIYIHEIPVAYEFVKLFAQGTLDASYALRKQDGSPTLYSKRTFATVIGNPSLLPAPKIREVVGNILPHGISAASVVIQYSSVASGDVITLIWLGTKLNGDAYVHEQEHTVSSGEAQAGILTIYVAGEHVEVLNGGHLKLNYRVYNDATSQYGVSESDYLRVLVDTVRGTLPAPEVPEAREGVINPLLTTFAHALIKPVDWKKGDTLTYHWMGLNDYGSTTGSVPITVMTIGQPVRFRVDDSIIKASIGYSVTVTYTLLHADTGKYSYSLPLEVLIGIPLGWLPHPDVLKAVLDSLNPMDALPDGVDIECSYASMDNTLDSVVLKWKGTPGPGSSEDQEKPAQASGVVSFRLLPEVVGPNIGRSVQVSYEVRRYGLLTPSDTLTLNVLTFQDPEKDLPTPRIVQAQKSDLYVMELDADADARVEPWPFIAVRQLVWLYVEAETSTGTYRIDVLTAHEVTSAQVTQGLDARLLRSELLKLLHGSTATLICKVIFDNSGNEASAVIFPAQPLIVHQHYPFVTPVITHVKNSQSVDIPEGGLTYDKRITIEGTATRAENVDIQVNGDSKGVAPVDANSQWTLDTNLELGLQRILAIAQYDADEKISAPRTFTIAEASTPAITKVIDSIGPVGHNGSTYDKALTVNVSADPNQSLQLYDGANKIGSAIPLDANGNGTTGVTNLSERSYTLIAQAEYGDQLKSAEHIFTVKAHLPVTLTSVRHSAGELSNGGRTYDASVTVSGQVTPFYAVQIYDNNNPVGSEVPSLSNGIWTTPLPVNIGGHSVYAKAIATGLNSNTRTFTRDNLPPLNPGPTKSLHLSGFIVAQDRRPYYTPAEATFTQPASGGVGPYTYWSANTGIAVVSGATVTCLNNGTTQIYVRDARGTQAYYTLQVSGIRTMLRNDGNWRKWVDAHNYCVSRGGRLPTVNEMLAFYTLYARESFNVARLLGWPLIDDHPHNRFGAWCTDYWYFNLSGTNAHGSNVPYGRESFDLFRPTCCLYG